MSDLDLAELRASFRAVLDDVAASAEVRRHVDAGAPFLLAAHRKAAELGWFGLTTPEAHGGLALGFDTAAVLYEELGRAVAPLPMLGNLLAVQLLAAGAARQRAAWLPRLASGEIIAGIGAAALSPAWDEARVTRKADGISLNGTARNLLDGASATLLLIAARDEAGVPLWVLAPVADASMQAVALVDRTRSLAEARFDNAPLSADHIVAGDAEAAAAIMLTHASMALACDSIGGARAILATTVAYLKTREQFGKPIGSFQALKHRCAEHTVALEASAALVEDAVARWARGGVDAPLRAALAKAHACDTFAAIAEDAVQLHGGIGFTWEHVCHLYLKRAKLNQALFGSCPAHRDYAATLLLAA